MRTSHKMLLRLRHDPQFEFNKVRIEYINRGAPGNIAEVKGSEIINLVQFGMELKSNQTSILIPYHRIRRIIYEDKVLWEKRS